MSHARGSYQKDNLIHCDSYTFCHYIHIYNIPSRYDADYDIGLGSIENYYENNFCCCFNLWLDYPLKSQMETQYPPPSRLSYGPVYHQLGRRLRKFSKKIDPLLISAGMLNHQITAGRLDGIFIILTDSPDSDCESWANNHRYVYFGKAKHIQKMTILGENCQWHSHKPEVFVWHIKEIIFFRKSEHLAHYLDRQK